MSINTEYLETLTRAILMFNEYLHGDGDLDYQLLSRSAILADELDMELWRERRRVQG